MMFYVLFTAALFLKRGVGLTLSIAALLLLCALKISGVFATGGALPAVALNFWGDPIILAFVIGMVAAVAWKRGLRLGRKGVAATLAAFVAVAALTRLNSGMFDALPESDLLPRLARDGAALLLFAAGVFGPQVNVSRRFWAALVFIGDASYSLYLVHPFALRPFDKIWASVVGGHVPVAVFTALCLPVALAVGLAFYWLFERPMVLWFHRRRITRSATNSVMIPSASAT
jgi:peptidoglycan/LPS O-acetylase OafA/YrhL